MADKEHDLEMKMCPVRILLAAPGLLPYSTHVYNGQAIAERESCNAPLGLSKEQSLKMAFV